jgi:hypothetical protein
MSGIIIQSAIKDEERDQKHVAEQTYEQEKVQRCRQRKLYSPVAQKYRAWEPKERKCKRIDDHI